MTVIDKLRARLRSGVRPDAKPELANVPFKVRAAMLSSRLSHTTFLGLLAISAQTAYSGQQVRALSVDPARAMTSLPSSPYMPEVMPPPARVVADAHVAPVARVAPKVPDIAAPHVAASVLEGPTVEAPKIEATIAVAPPSVQHTPAVETAALRKETPVKVARKLKLPKARVVKVLRAPKALLKETTFVPLPIVVDVPPSNVITASDTSATRIAIKARDGKISRIAKTPKTTNAKVAMKADPAQVAAASPQGTVTKSEAYTVANVWSEEQISDARATCAKLLTSLDIVATESEPVKEGSCGAPAPINVRQLGTPKVQVQPPAMLTCPMVGALHAWMKDKVQPAALASFGSPVVRLISASSYSCRNRYGRSDGPLSEHALGNALDLSGFVLADGRTVRVLQDWGPVARDKAIEKKIEAVAESTPDAVTNVAATSRPGAVKAGLSLLGGHSLVKPPVANSLRTADKKTTPGAPADAGEDKGKPTGDKDAAAVTAKSTFLRKVHAEACDVFGTVLGPEANDAHRNHFHVDMKARRHKGYCQ